MKNIYIKIAKNLYDDGIPLGRGFDTGSLRPVFDGLFYIQYSAPHIEGDTSISLQCMGMISSAPTYKFAGILNQSSVTDILLPNDELINSIKKIFTEYLRDTKHNLPESRVNFIISRLISDIINNVPIKAVYKTLRQDNPSLYNKVETAYFSKTKKHIIQNIDEIQKSQQEYQYETTSPQQTSPIGEEYPEYIQKLDEKLKLKKMKSSFSLEFIKTAQAADFKEGDLLRINFDKFDEDELNEKDAKNLVALKKHVIEQIKKHNLNPKVFSFKRKTVNPDFYQISGIEKDSDGDAVVNINVWKGFLEKAKNLNTGMMAKQTGNDVGMEPGDVARFSRTADEYGLEPNEYAAYLKDAKNKGYFKGGKYTKEEFDKYYQNPGINVHDRAKQYGVDPATYTENLRAAGDENKSYEEYMKSKEEQKQGKEKEQKQGEKDEKEKTGLGLDAEDVQAAAEKYKKDPKELVELVKRAKKLGLFVDEFFKLADENDISLDEVLGAQHYIAEAKADGKNISFDDGLEEYLKENKSISKAISNEAMQGGYAAVKQSPKIFEAYNSYKENDQLEKLPEQFRKLVEELKNPEYIDNAILEHFQMNPKTFGNRERAIHNYYKIRDMFQQMQADGVTPPKHMTEVFNQITPIVHDRIVAEEFQKNAIPTSLFRNTKDAAKYKDKIMTAYNNIKAKDKNFNNPKLEKLVKIVQQAAPEAVKPETPTPAEQGTPVPNAVPGEEAM